MVAVGDIIRLDVKQQYQIDVFVEMHNVYYYEVATMTGSITLPDDTAEIATDFDSSVLSIVRNTQHNLLKYQSIQIDNCMNADEFGIYTYATEPAGSASGSADSSFVCWEYQLVRSTRQTRHGRKAIGGVSEDWSAGNSILVSFKSLIDDAAEAMALPFAVTTMSSTMGLRPVITRMPTTGLLPLKVNRVSNVVFSHVSTQRTRMT